MKRKSANAIHSIFLLSLRAARADFVESHRAELTIQGALPSTLQPVASLRSLDELHPEDEFDSTHPEERF